MKEGIKPVNTGMTESAKFCNQEKEYFEVNLKMPGLD